jgi:HSP20 family protein
MRYRRVVGRYFTFVSTGAALPHGDLLRESRSSVLVAPAHWRPATDVYETAEALSIMVDLAGIDLDDLDVLLLDDALIVQGTRHPRVAAPTGVYHHAEIRYGPFRLEVRLPHTVDASGIDARYEQGMLLVTLPKVRSGPRQPADGPNDAARAGRE